MFITTLAVVVKDYRNSNCEIFCQENPHSLLRPSQMRWLSLGQVYRILEHWTSLIVFFFFLIGQYQMSDR
jgi:hypothetical protein